MRLLLGMDGFFYLSFPGKQVYWMVAENGRFESMKQKKEREKEISQWPWISMLPFGILAGYWGDKEVRITAISEYGFQTRLAAPATAEQKNAPWELAFYDQKTASYQRILLRDATFLQEKEEDFDVVYTSPRNKKIIEMRYSTLPCNTASIFAGKWRTMMPLLQNR